MVLKVLEKLSLLGQLAGLDFSSTAIVGVQHVLEQMIPFAEALACSKLEAKRAFIVRKIYSTVPGVKDAIESTYPQISFFETKETDYGEDVPFSMRFQRDVLNNWDRLEVELLPAIEAGGVTTLLILDDGGTAITEGIRRLNAVYQKTEGGIPLAQTSVKFWDTFFKKGCRLAAVEQTSAGVQNIIDYSRSHPREQLTFPIILLASSALKVLLESKLIAEHFLRKFELFYGKEIQAADAGHQFRLGIIGLGNIGSSIALSLKQRYGDKLSVMVYDRDPKREDLLPRDSFQFVSRDEHADLPIVQVMQHSQCIIGCTGRDVFPPSSQMMTFLNQMTKSLTFISASSENSEFYQLIQWVKEQRDFKSPETLLDDLKYTTPSGLKITICYRGYPFNFIKPPPGDISPVGIPPERFQIILGALFAALQQAQGIAVTQLPVDTERKRSEGCAASFFQPSIRQWLPNDFFHQLDPRIQQLILDVAFETKGLFAGEYTVETLKVFDGSGDITVHSVYKKKDPCPGSEILMNQVDFGFEQSKTQERFPRIEAYQRFYECLSAEKVRRFECEGYDFSSLLSGFYLEKHSTVHVIRSARSTQERSLSIEQIYCRLAMISAETQQEKEERLKRSRSFSYEMFDQLYSEDGDHFIEPLKLFSPENGSSGRRVLVVGKAGIGKTTFCQYLAHYWATGRGAPNDFLRSFKWCFWIPLRDLVYCENCQSIAGVIKKLYFSSDSRITEQNINSLFERDAERILLLLDGYDETVKFLKDSPLWKLRDSLIHHPACYTVVTSRPYYLEESGHYDLTYEIIGYTLNDVYDYIRKYFNETPEIAERTIEALKQQPFLFAIAKIPLLLQLICSLLETQPDFDLSRLQITDLYHQLYLNLLREHISLRAKEWLPAVLPGNLTDREVVESCKPITEFYEAVAFSAFLNGNIIIEPMLLESALQEVKSRMDAAEVDVVERFLRRKGWSDERIRLAVLSDFAQKGDLLHGALSCGLLIGTGRDSLEVKRSHYFVHLSFQEYFVAHYLHHCWQEGRGVGPDQSVEEFIERNKFNPRYEMVWWFFAGLLEDREKLEAFFKCLTGGVIRDLSKQYFYRLLVRCVDNAFDKIVDLEGPMRFVRNWVDVKLSKGEVGLERSRRGALSNVLELSPKIANFVKREWFLRDPVRFTGDHPELTIVLLKASDDMRLSKESLPLLDLYCSAQTYTAKENDLSFLVRKFSYEDVAPYAFRKMGEVLEEKKLFYLQVLQIFFDHFHDEERARFFRQVQLLLPNDRSSKVLKLLSLIPRDAVLNFFAHELTPGQENENMAAIKTLNECDFLDLDDERIFGLLLELFKKQASVCELFKRLTHEGNVKTAITCLLDHPERCNSLPIVGVLAAFYARDDRVLRFLLPLIRSETSDVHVRMQCLIDLHQNGFRLSGELPARLTDIILHSFSDISFPEVAQAFSVLDDYGAVDSTVVSVFFAALFSGGISPIMASYQIPRIYQSASYKTQEMLEKYLCMLLSSQCISKQLLDDVTLYIKLPRDSFSESDSDSKFSSIPGEMAKLVKLDLIEALCKLENPHCPQDIASTVYSEMLSLSRTPSGMIFRLDLQYENFAKFLKKTQCHQGIEYYGNLFLNFMFKDLRMSSSEKKDDPHHVFLAYFWLSQLDRDMLSHEFELLLEAARFFQGNKRALSGISRALGAQDLNAHLGGKEGQQLVQLFYPGETDDDLSAHFKSISEKNAYRQFLYLFIILPECFRSTLLKDILRQYLDSRGRRPELLDVVVERICAQQTPIYFVGNEVVFYEPHEVRIMIHDPALVLVLKEGLKQAFSKRSKEYASLSDYSVLEDKPVQSMFFGLIRWGR